MDFTGRRGLPLSFCTDSVRPAEIKLVARNVDERFVADVPGHLIWDKAYDSAGLDGKTTQE